MWNLTIFCHCYDRMSPRYEPLSLRNWLCHQFGLLNRKRCFFLSYCFYRDLGCLCSYPFQASFLPYLLQDYWSLVNLLHLCLPCSMQEHLKTCFFVRLFHLSFEIGWCLLFLAFLWDYFFQSQLPRRLSLVSNIWAQQLRTQPNSSSHYFLSVYVL